MTTVGVRKMVVKPCRRHENKNRDVFFPVKKRQASPDPEIGGNFKYDEIRDRFHFFGDHQMNDFQFLYSRSIVQKTETFKIRHRRSLFAKSVICTVH